MKALSLFGILAVGLFLTACGKDGGTIASEQPYRSGHSGTVDGGGGNGHDGVPLEYFRVDAGKEIAKVPGLQHVLDAVEKAFLPLAGDMRHIREHRRWYMITAPLEELPASKIGVSVKEKDLQQLAIQSTSEVWFDKNLYDPMPVEGKLELLLHELLMGVRILEFVDSFDLCQTKATYDLLLSSPEHKYDEKFKKCVNIYGPSSTVGGIFNPATQINLGKKDYENIRELVTTLASKPDEIDGKWLETWLYIKNFRKYK
jgi:hypothetical protein